MRVEDNKIYMDDEEALKILTNMAYQYDDQDCEEVIALCIACGAIDDCNKMNEQENTAKEFRTPKSVERLDQKDKNGNTIYCCPHCGVMIPRNSDNYCYNCGQCLDWRN